jgi:hypothetical protein
LLGAADAQYNIKGTSLPLPHRGALLEKITFSAGKIITGGGTIAIGVNHIPPHLVREGYIPQLRWIHTRYVVLWDEGDKRGWLVNGTSALLHLVRMALKSYKADKFSTALLFEESKLKDGNEHNADSAIEVLIDDGNRELEIWPGKREYFMEEEEKENPSGGSGEISKSWKRKRGFTLFEDLVEQQYAALEQIIDYQQKLAGANGVNLKTRARKHLEGWDFKELATGYDPSPRVATLHALGYGWVDFVRSINAVTLSGCGFGDIIRPTPTDDQCPEWSQLPKGRYYLAASTHDLDKIIEVYGIRGSDTIEPVRNLLWHSPRNPFAICHCQTRGSHRKWGKLPIGHHDPVQVFCPQSSKWIRKVRKPASLEGNGVIVFGHTVSWPYRWKEAKNRDEEQEDLVHDPELPAQEPNVLTTPEETNGEPEYSDISTPVTGYSSRTFEDGSGDQTYPPWADQTTLTTPGKHVTGQSTTPITEDLESSEDCIQYTSGLGHASDPQSLSNRPRLFMDRSSLYDNTSLDHYGEPSVDILSKKSRPTLRTDISRLQLVRNDSRGTEEDRPKILRRERRHIGQHLQKERDNTH